MCVETLAKKYELLLTENGQFCSLAEVGFIIGTECELVLKSTELNMSYMSEMILVMYDHKSPQTHNVLSDFPNFKH